MTNEKLALVCNCKTLKEFWISRNPIDDYGLVALKKLNVLERLEVSYSQVTGAGLFEATKGGGLKSLTGLGLYSCPLNAAGAKAISMMKSLENLNLGEVHALNDEALHIMLLGMKHLKHLNLNKCSNINGQGLGALKGNKEIEDLQLTQCSGIGDGVIPFLKTLKSLKVLGCSGTAITPNGISAMKSALPDLKIN